MTFSQLFRPFGKVFQLKSFKLLLLFIMVIYIGLGIGIILSTYFMTYYFGLSEKEFAPLLLGTAMGGILALMIGPKLGARWGKRKTAVIGTLGFAFLFSLPFILRLLGWFPENGDPLLLPIYSILNLFAYFFLWTY